MKSPYLVRFDWAAKRLLRNKSNFVVLEGFLSVLLEEEIKIDQILESEGNQENESDKFNRVDMLAINSKGELILVEVQNNRELDYFHRMLYGTSKVITQYMGKGDKYEKVRKVYSINIVYFELGQGSDYLYHGKTNFVGVHNNDTLKLSLRQKEVFIRQEAGDIFPEYYVIRVDDFDKHATSPLEEWITFLKTGVIDENAKAAGLPEARERLRIDALPENEQKAYWYHVEAVNYQRSVIETGRYEGFRDGEEKGIKEGKEEGLKEGIEIGKEEGLKEGMEKGKEEGLKEGLKKAVHVLNSMGVSLENISANTGLTVDEVKKLLEG